jgi:hypothetical protein
MLNQINKSDPVAFRIEPLIAKSYAKQKPVQIPYTKGGFTGTIVGISEVSTNIFAAVRDNIVTTTLSVVTNANKAIDRIIPTKNEDSDKDKERIEMKTVNNATNETAEMREKRHIVMLNPRGRIDFCLQEGVLENPYLSALAVQYSYIYD